MIRDLIGLLLVATGGALGFMAYYLAKAGVRIAGRRWWPPWRMPTEVKLSGVFSSLGLLLAVLGLLTLGGTGPLPAWSIPLLLYVASWVGLLWWDFAHPPVVLEVSGES